MQGLSVCGLDEGRRQPRGSDATDALPGAHAGASRGRCRGRTRAKSAGKLLVHRIVCRLFGEENRVFDMFCCFYLFVPKFTYSCCLGQLRQRTPLRVLHRRSLLTRTRYIYSMTATPLNPHYFLLDLVTSAGE